MRRLVLLGLALVLLLSAGAALATDEGGGIEIPRWVIAGGGGRSEAGRYALTGTIGQAVVGTGSGGSYEVCSGFWAGPCGWEPVAERLRIYLPVVMRGYP
jgi:hypothetical protein